MTAFLIILAPLILLTVILVVISPGTPEAFPDESNTHADSIEGKFKIIINGVEQGMFIQSRDIHNPVLLFVHGGPGMPEYWLTQRYPTGLENYFTVVWWEQRGAGLSFHADIPPETMNVEQYIADTLEVTRFLQKRFNQKKIYLMGHSWGSFLGIQAAARAPELYYAYIGMGQITNQLKSEQLAYQYALTEYRARGDTAMVQKMEAAPPTMTVPLPAVYEKLRDTYMHGAGIGTTHQMRSVFTGIFLQSWLFRGYTIAEKLNLWRGKMYSRSSDFRLWETMLTTDLTHQIQKLDIPVYFFHGRYDYTCAYPLAHSYFAQLQAPVKGFYTFENSAHSPLFEEPRKALEIMTRDVLHGSTDVTDDHFSHDDSPLGNRSRILSSMRRARL